MADTVTTLYF